MNELHNTTVNVLIVGAGLAGIGMAAKLSMSCPDRDFLVLEQRDNIGGTWDLFRYPGVRSDSDMHTLGYSFKPWPRNEAIADGESIKDYIVETAKEFGVYDKIKFGHRVIKACWSSEEKCWYVFAQQSKDNRKCVIRTSFLIMCSGYYDYDQGHVPDLPRSEHFSGPIIHPQHWPEDFDFAEKCIVVIGSGASAVTLAPALSHRASNVVMLQRSPSYIASRPRVDYFANVVRKLLGDKFAYSFIRARNIKVQRIVYWTARNFPDWLGRRLIRLAREQMPNLDDFERHMHPKYNPCEQRLCLIPDGDLFRSVRDGRVRIVTGDIEHVTQDGIALKSGEHLECDAIVTATGLNMAVFGKASFYLDGRPVSFPDHTYYKGVMLNDIPNFVSMFGYVNISWTLRIELIANYVCRLLNVMDRKGASLACPKLTTRNMSSGFIFDTSLFSPGYYMRSRHIFPKNGNERPWMVSQSYTEERKMFNTGLVDDGILIFS